MRQKQPKASAPALLTVHIRLPTGPAVLCADTKRTAVREYLEQARRHRADMAWRVVANRRGRVNKIVTRDDGAHARLVLLPQVEGDDHALLVGADPEQLVVSSTSQVLRDDGCDVVAGVAERLDGPLAEILVQLEFHAAGSADRRNGRRRASQRRRRTRARGLPQCPDSPREHIRCCIPPAGSRRPALAPTEFRRAYRGESQYVEFKQGVSEGKIAEALTGFSNADGGVIFIGVGADGTVHGTNADGEARAQLNRAVAKVHDPGRTTSTISASGTSKPLLLRSRGVTRNSRRQLTGTCCSAATR